jgi:hypothetical protein
VKGDGVTRLVEFSGTRPPSRVGEPIPFDRPPRHLEIGQLAAVLVDLPGRRVVAENLMVPVSNIDVAVSFILGLDNRAQRGAEPISFSAKEESCCCKPFPGRKRQPQERQHCADAERGGTRDSDSDAGMQ